jgi:hypothetical protein
VGFEDGDKRIGAPAQEVVGRVVEGVQADLPAIAVGDAERDEGVGGGGRRGLLPGRSRDWPGAENFEESDDRQKPGWDIARGTIRAEERKRAGAVVAQW